MIGRYLPAALAVIACAATLWAYAEITFLRGTIFWEFRFLVLLAAVFLVLTLVETVLGRLLPSGDHTDGEE